MSTSKVWEYRAGNWLAIDYPLPEPTHDNVDEDLKSLGYMQAGHELGNSNACTFCATLYSHSQPEQVKGYQWLVRLDIGYGPIESVFVAALPDLIKLLKDCSTIATATVLSVLSDEIDNIMILAEKTRISKKQQH